MPAELIGIDEARTAVVERSDKLEEERVPLAQALGRVLAEDVASVAPVPPFDSSAMDGFAVRVEDVRGARPEQPVELAVLDESRAGHPSERALSEGGAIAISTGALLPRGTEAIVALEQAQRHDGRVDIHEEVAPGAHMRRAGDDVQMGARVLSARSRLGPAELGALAGLGLAEITCVSRPRASVITTGDELVAPGSTLRPGQIYNSNGASVAALVRQLGAELALVESVPDEPGATRETIARALAVSEVVVICGGVSVGDHDHVKDALASLEVHQCFWGVALKPGKPTWFGVRGRQLVFGLPGNPVSAMVTFALFVAPALRALEGRRELRRRAGAALAHEYRKPAGRAHALRCRLRMGRLGVEANTEGDTGSHVLSSMLGAQALAIIPRECERVPAGARVELELLGEPRLSGS
jgi:molybdopterin molybdotransferase